MHLNSKLVLIAACILTACQTPGARPTQTATAAQAKAALPHPPVVFPADVNPLTGERVLDPSLLKVPALLVSISHFPATARPQSGLSFAPFVYEYYITEGATRFLAVYYGETPAPEIPVSGGCEARSGPFEQDKTLLGHRVWLDANGNGLQDPWEGGISGLCINLYDAGGNLLQRTSTDSNGYYGFNVKPGRYTVEFVKPDGLKFTQPDAGDDALDSDADPATGRVDVKISDDNRTVDAGLQLKKVGAPTPDPAIVMPAAQVGPVRSGRLIYGYIADYFQNSCLIYAFASPEVLEHLPQCHMVFHQLVGGGYMMDLSEMQDVAEQNQQAKGSDFSYASNVYSEDVPAGGQPASALKVYFAYLNQSGWAYDPLYRAYLRYVDTAEFDQAGVLHPDMDRLTGRQLHFENIIVLYARHKVVSPTNLDIRLEQGKSGDAALFRDGQMFDITWSTEQDPNDPSGYIRPIRFLGQDGAPIALAPGHTWIIVVTPHSGLNETAAGQWTLNFAQPEGAK